MNRFVSRATAGALVASLVWAPATPAHAAEDDVLIEFHYKPVPNAQIAIWIEDTEGNFVQDVFVTQATGALGIGNRPGRYDFLSSWRFPYGPRAGVLPIWGHARGKTYPELVFHDDDSGDQNSLGWHENTSWKEPYFCRPLTADEHEVISTDTMTCPSPTGFNSDKGRFSSGTSVYPPRNDLIEFNADKDHPDIKQFAEINDLDGISMATPSGNAEELMTTVLSAELAAAGPLVAWIEINLEDDQNASWSFDRAADHYVDPRLSNFGIGYFGQPSVVYRVEFDPSTMDFAGTDAYVGYGDLDGASGQLHEPDGTIETEGGSGADRLQLLTKNGETFRFGVFSHGPGTGEGGENPENPWGGCTLRELPAMDHVELEPLDFDQVRVHFAVPQIPGSVVRNVRLYYRAGTMALAPDNLSAAYQQVPAESDCGGAIAPGVTTWCDLNELWGNTDYQVGIRYEDACSNSSNLVASTIRTPAQKFATVDGLCFVATAAWGAPWAGKVQALRWFRDLYMKQSGVGWALVSFYYSSSPGLARMIARFEIARALTRVVLGPVAAFAEATTATMHTAR